MTYGVVVTHVTLDHVANVRAVLGQLKITTMRKHLTLENLIYAALISLICLGINWRDKRTATINYNNGFRAGVEFVIDTLNKIADELETKNLCE